MHVCAGVQQSFREPGVGGGVRGRGRVGEWEGHAEEEPELGKRRTSNIVE